MGLAPAAMAPMLFSLALWFAIRAVGLSLAMSGEGMAMRCSDALSGLMCVSLSERQLRCDCVLVLSRLVGIL